MAFLLTWITTALTHFAYGHQFLSFLTWSRFASVSDKEMFYIPLPASIIQSSQSVWIYWPLLLVLFLFHLSYFLLHHNRRGGKEKVLTYFVAALIQLCDGETHWFHLLTGAIAKWWIRPTVLLNKYFPLVFVLWWSANFCYVFWLLCNHFLSHAFIYCIFSYLFALFLRDVL